MLNLDSLIFSLLSIMCTQSFPTCTGPASDGFEWAPMNSMFVFGIQLVLPRPPKGEGDDEGIVADMKDLRPACSWSLKHQWKVRRPKVIPRLKVFVISYNGRALGAWKFVLCDQVLLVCCASFCSPFCGKLRVINGVLLYRYQSSLLAPFFH